MSRQVGKWCRSMGFWGSPIFALGSFCGIVMDLGPWKMSSPTNLNEKSLTSWGVLVQHILASNFDYQVTTGSLKRKANLEILGSLLGVLMTFRWATCHVYHKITGKKHLQRGPIIRQEWRGVPCAFVCQAGIHGSTRWCYACELSVTGASSKILGL